MLGNIYKHYNGQNYRISNFLNNERHILKQKFIETTFFSPCFIEN